MPTIISSRVISAVRYYTHSHHELKICGYIIRQDFDDGSRKYIFSKRKSYILNPVYFETILECIIYIHSKGWE